MSAPTFPEPERRYLMATAIRHGSGNGYHTNRCRCTQCLAYHARQLADWRQARADGVLIGLRSPIPTMRRLRALAAVGNSGQRMADLLGTPVTTIREIIRGERIHIQAQTADDVATLYDRIAHEDGPDIRCVNHARRHGWDGPDAWNSDTIDDLDAQPWSVATIDELGIGFAVEGNAEVARKLPAPERREVVRILSQRGRTASQIATLCAVDQRTIQYDRQHLSRTLVAA